MLTVLRHHFPPCPDWSVDQSYLYYPPLPQGEEETPGGDHLWHKTDQLLGSYNKRPSRNVSREKTCQEGVEDIADGS